MLNGVYGTPLRPDDTTKFASSSRQLEKWMWSALVDCTIPSLGLLHTPCPRERRHVDHRNHEMPVPSFVSNWSPYWARNSPHNEQTVRQCQGSRRASPVAQQQKTEMHVPHTLQYCVTVHFGRACSRVTKKDLCMSPFQIGSGSNISQAGNGSRHST